MASKNDVSEDKKARVNPLIKTQESSQFPRYHSSNLIQEIDEKGDYIFHFRLNSAQLEKTQTLEDFYRESIYDLLQLVRFYNNGEPVQIDSFAFLNQLQKQIRIVEPHFCDQ